MVKVMDELTKQPRDQLMYGPLRIFPGRLSVSRAFGDIEAKRRKYGGNHLVLNAVPDIKHCKIEDQYDFILLGCDGIFDKLTDTQVLKAVWESARKRYSNTEISLHSLSGAAVETVLKLSVDQNTADNITVVVICFKNFKKQLKKDLLQADEERDSEREEPEDKT